MPRGTRGRGQLRDEDLLRGKIFQETHFGDMARAHAHSQGDEHSHRARGHRALLLQIFPLPRRLERHRGHHDSFRDRHDPLRAGRPRKHGVLRERDTSLAQKDARAGPLLRRDARARGRAVSGQDWHHHGRQHGSERHRPAGRTFRRGVQRHAPRHRDRDGRRQRDGKRDKDLPCGRGQGERGGKLRPLLLGKEVERRAHRRRELCPRCCGIRSRTRRRDAGSRLRKGGRGLSRAGASILKRGLHRRETAR